jgi:hypothetical protein
MILLILLLIGCVRADHYLECRVQNERGYQLETYIATVNPGGKVQLFCQLFTNNLDEEHDPSLLNATSMLNVTQNTLLSYPNNETRMWQLSVVFNAPLNNQLAYEANGKKIKCQYGNLFCYIQVNVLFRPFVDTSILHTQTFSLGETHAFVECPIRAPTYPPFQHYIIWHSEMQSADAYTMNSFLLNLKSVDNTMNNKIATCSLHYNNTGFRMFNETITVHVTTAQTWFYVIIALLCMSISVSPRFLIFIYTRVTGDGQEGIYVTVRDRQERTEEVGLERGGGALPSSSSSPSPPFTNLYVKSLNLSQLTSIDVN